MIVASCLVTMMIMRGDAPAVVENDRTEQQVVDGDALLIYLNTHYYNSTEINALENPTVDDLVFTTLLEGETVPSDATKLIERLKLKQRLTRMLNMYIIF